MRTFQPKIIETLKNYSGKQFTSDIIAGIIVAIIALPLSIALAIASGVEPIRGLYTAVVAGFVIALLGGSRVNISGPTAAFAVIVAGIVAQHGISGLAVATIMAGIILIIMGAAKLGSLIKYIPATITTGFTAGIAVTIAIGQIKDFLGLTYPSGTHAVETSEKLLAVVENIGTINPWGAMVGVVCLLVLIVWPKVSKKIPGSLISVIVGVLMVEILKRFGIDDVATIGSSFGEIKASFPPFTLPRGVNLDMILTLLPSAFTIAILAGIESLLSCVVSDGMIKDKHNSNTELIAQGAGNICSALFGGIPATGAIARTAANVNNGGRSPISGIVHSLVLLLVLVVFMPYAKFIPMPTIAAILFMVAYNMSEWRKFVKVCKCAPRSDIFVLVLTFLLTVIFDLVVAIEVGLVITLILFMRRMELVTGVRLWTNTLETEQLKGVPDGTKVFDIDGALFFATTDVIPFYRDEDDIKAVIFRMRGVQSIDITAMWTVEKIYKKYKDKGVEVIFSHVNDQPLAIMKKSG
ncbi:MAG: STAS domain-containing protein, partial [Clostridia bacterium]|nr:STAS domain-containing protein [Clostridia bacterium]